MKTDDGGITMSKIYVIYNPLANNGRSGEEIEKFIKTIEGEAVLCDMTCGYMEYIDSLKADDTLIICGGDGTLNRFINETDGKDVPCDILYFASGSGNDFAHEISLERSAAPVSIKKYIKELPEVEVKGKTYKFINGVGYGIDGYCCEEGDRIRAEKPGEKVDYTSIAIKGLLGKFKPKNARITVDGVEHEYKKVWLAPTMHGRYYGGGMIATPNQSRENSETLSLMVWHGSNKLKTLMVFPSIFKGEHIKETKYIEVIEGRDITVEFDQPCALQVDGETILGVSSYTAHARVHAKV